MLFGLNEMLYVKFLANRIHIANIVIDINSQQKEREITIGMFQDELGESAQL